MSGHLRQQIVALEVPGVRRKSSESRHGVGLDRGTVGDDVSGEGPDAGQASRALMSLPTEDRFWTIGGHEGQVCAAENEDSRAEGGTGGPSRRRPGLPVPDDLATGSEKGEGGTGQMHRQLGSHAGERRCG